MWEKLKHFFCLLGPGMLMAGAAIGVSHLVQSTRAGADFGFQLIGVVLVANIFKYPFFEVAHRYTAGTGETLLHGYEKLGRAYLVIYFLLNIVVSVGSVAAVSFVTAALLENLLMTGLGIPTVTAGILLVCCAIYAIGHYHWLDIIIKVLMLLLFVATVSAFILALDHGGVMAEGFISPSPWNLAALPFLIALMGWMPGPLEMSSWQSIWMEAKIRDCGHRPTLKEAQIDFNTGYGLCIVLAVMFVCLGAFMMHGSGQTFSDSAVGFAGQVVDLYVAMLGEWARPVIGIAAFTAMFSTTLTLLDAYPRAMAICCHIFSEKKSLKNISYGKWRWGWTAFCAGGGLYIIAMTSGLKAIVDAVTIIAFLAAPLFAFMNYRLIFASHVPDTVKPKGWMKVMMPVGLLYLFGFALLYLAFRLGLLG
jgi:Mn2+/Fe2+ NRAMP family transporter